MVVEGTPTGSSQPHNLPRAACQHRHGVVFEHLRYGSGGLLEQGALGLSVLWLSTAEAATSWCATLQRALTLKESVVTSDRAPLSDKTTTTDRQGQLKEAKGVREKAEASCEDFTEQPPPPSLPTVLNALTARVDACLGNAVASWAASVAVGPAPPLPLPASASPPKQAPRRLDRR